MIVLLHKADGRQVKAGDFLLAKPAIGIARTIEVREILSPSFKFGAAGILATDGLVYLPTQCGCYVETR